MGRLHLRHETVRYKGHEVKSKDVRKQAVLLVGYRFAPSYEWSCGQALSFFLSKLKEAQIWGTKCRRCSRVLIPPRIYCEECFRNIDEWVRLGDTGIIKTFSLSYVNTDASRRQEPQIVAVIHIDGSSPGMGLLHTLGGVNPHKVKVGMRVKAVWKPKNQRRGSITDIVYFKPI